MCIGIICLIYDEKSNKQKRALFQIASLCSRISDSQNMLFSAGEESEKIVFTNCIFTKTEWKKWWNKRGVVFFWILSTLIIRLMNNLLSFP